MRGLNIIAGMAVVIGAGLAVTASSTRAQTGDVTFAKDIAPILQRSCVACHTRKSGAEPAGNLDLDADEESIQFEHDGAVPEERRTIGKRRPPWRVDAIAVGPPEGPRAGGVVPDRGLSYSKITSCSGDTVQDGSGSIGPSASSGSSRTSQAQPRRSARRWTGSRPWMWRCTTLFSRLPQARRTASGGPHT